MEWREITCYKKMCICVCVCVHGRLIYVRCVCVHLCLLERKKGSALLLPPTCSCNPLCFGDLGNLVTKHSWGPFDWGHGWAWSLDWLKRQWRRESWIEEEEDKVLGALRVGRMSTPSVHLFPLVCMSMLLFLSYYITFSPACPS